MIGGYSVGMAPPEAALGQEEHLPHRGFGAAWASKMASKSLQIQPATRIQRAAHQRNPANKLEPISYRQGKTCTNSVEPRSRPNERWITNTTKMS
jgi:hypothetical protein